MPSTTSSKAANRRPVLAAVVVLLAACGCAGSSDEEANALVERATRQAAVWFEAGNLDEARRAIDEARAVEGATRTEDRDALARKIDEACLRRDTEQFDRAAAESLEKIPGLDREQRRRAAALVAEAVPQASPAQRQLAQTLVTAVGKAVAENEAARYWRGFELAALIDFREKAILPDQWAAPIALGGEHGEAVRRLYRETLETTLPDALARAEIRADRPVDPDHSLPSPSIEEVAANPGAWLDQRVQFERVWISGRITPTLRDGQLLTVTSTAGRVHEPRMDEGRLVFVGDRRIAYEIKSLIAEGSKSRGRVFCRIEQTRGRETTRPTSYYRALVFKFELYSDNEDDE
ncbi:MAG: hypothetical protein GX621_12705 [Pirellulaceae bacterium]|nr:hypothetical protein [Pirellulaceae bacterium]